MRGKRRKYLAKKIRENDPKLIEAIRAYIGPRAVMFKTNQLYKWAKKLWTENKIKQTMLN